MRRLLLIPALFSIISATGQTSTYHPLPDSGAVWNFSVAGFCFWGFATDFYSIRIDGDTLINGTVYHKLSTPFVVHNSCAYVNPGYKGAFRNDTMNRKVYYVAPNSSVDSLLYDFNLQPGDTVRGLLGCCLSPSLVQSIDSVQVGTSYRKRWVLDCYSVSIIEGVGSTYGLVNPVPGCFAVDLPDYSLDCFSDSSGNLYPSAVSACQLIDYLTDLQANTPRFDIFPNPALNEVHFKTSHTGPAVVEVRQPDGKRLISQLIDFSQPDELKLSVDGLSAGCYTISISSSEFLMSRKLIVY